MNVKYLCLIAVSSLFFSKAYTQEKNKLQYEDEKHLANVRQLTFGGDNAEAYFSNNDQWLTMQITNPKAGINCDQIFLLDLNSKEQKLIPASTGKGRTTCSFFMPEDKAILFASTHATQDTCPPVPDRKVLRKYVWPIYESYDIYTYEITGTDVNEKELKPLTNTPGYDAEATVSPKGDKIIFTSMRSGDLELYVMNIDGTDVKQITNTIGYDGGANFSPDGSMIVWRASRPQTPEEQNEYMSLLKQGLVAPTQMELFVANADGSNARQITKLGKANWAPSFLPDGKRIIFSSNHEYERGFPFNLYVIDINGDNLEKITHDGGFDAFPMFSHDGKKIVFSSNRNNGGGHDTNVFIADWVE